MPFANIIVLILVVCDAIVIVTLDRKTMSHESASSQYLMLFTINVATLLTLLIARSM